MCKPDVGASDVERPVRSHTVRLRDGLPAWLTSSSSTSAHGFLVSGHRYGTVSSLCSQDSVVRSAPVYSERCSHLVENASERETPGDPEVTLTGAH